MRVKAAACLSEIMPFVSCFSHACTAIYHTQWRVCWGIRREAHAMHVAILALILCYRLGQGKVTGCICKLSAMFGTHGLVCLRVSVLILWHCATDMSSGRGGEHLRIDDLMKPLFCTSPSGQIM